MPAAFGFSGLRSRLLLPVLLAAAPAAILVLLTGRAWREREQGDAIAAAREAGQHAAVVHAQNLAQVRRMLATIAAVGVDRPFVDPTWRAVLVKAIDDHALFENICVVDADGGVESVAAPLDAATRHRIHALTSTTAARAGLSDDDELEVTPRGPTALVIAPVGYGRGGAPRWLAAIVRLSWLRDTTALGALPKGTIETISDRSGRMLLQVPESSAGRSSDTSGDEIVRIALTSAGTRSPGVSPVSRGDGDLAREATMPAMLFMTIGMPRTAVTADADRFFRGTSAILLASVALALTVAWRSTGRLSREIDGLLTTTTRLADGDSSRPANADASVEELARLGQGLDRLSATFARRERDIVRRHDHTLQGLSSALEQTADSVFITDRAGIIRYVNPAFEALTGYTRDEAIGQTPRLFSSGSHERKFYEGLWATILAGQVFRAIVTNRAKDGRLFNEDQTITPIRDQDGTITDFVSTGRDITERRRIDQALRRLNTALEHEAARIASVLHDEASQFLSSAHITLADVGRDLAPDLRARVQIVRHHLDLAEEQLRRVSHELHPRILDDLGLVEAVRFLSIGFGRRNNIPVHVDVPEASSLPRAVETVCYRLVQEGLTNVGKHASATHVSVVLARQGARVVCSVRDNGVGFDAAAVEERDGFSLGLTLMRDRIEAVGGTLTIVSAPQQGTELRASIPVEV